MKLVIDTDIGDDWDDIFTLAVALASPEADLLGITTVAGDVGLRARLTRRFLALAGRDDVPVAIGAATPSGAPFTHRRWAEGGPPLGNDEPEAAEFLLRTIAAHPAQVTLLAMGPSSNLAEALRRDPATFGKLGRIVLMGGAVRRSYRDMPWQASRGPSREYNILTDVAAAQAVFAAAVPLVVAPLDATMVALDEIKRTQIFTRSTPICDALALTYLQWAAAGRSTPILFDTVALAYALEPTLCSVERLNLLVDAEGYTRIGEGAPNAEVLVDCDEGRFHRWVMPRLLGQPARG